MVLKRILALVFFAKGRLSMEIDPVAPVNRFAPLYQKFDALKRNRVIVGLALTAMTAIATLFLMQGFASPARETEGKVYSQISYADIAPLALLTSLTSLVYIWPIFSMTKQSKLLGCVLCGLIFGSIFPFYRLANCLHTNYPPVQTLGEVEACKQYFIENQDQYFAPDCLMHPIDNYTGFCEWDSEALPPNIEDCFRGGFFTEYDKIAPVDRYQEYKRCLPSSEFMASPITQSTILTINSAAILLALAKAARHIRQYVRERQNYRQLEEPINV